jgi:hypothetical protein
VRGTTYAVGTAQVLVHNKPVENPYAQRSAPRPVIENGLPARVTEALPEGEIRTPQELEQARNFYKRNIEEARQWWEERTGHQWPDNPSKPGAPQWAEHPRALKNGGDPLYIEPGVGPDPNAPHQVVGPDGLTDSERFGRMGGRPRENPPQ